MLRVGPYNEMFYSVDIASCIKALWRFVCRSDQVTQIQSDNGTNLVGAENELQKAESLNGTKIRFRKRCLSEEFEIAFESCSSWQSLGKTFAFIG